VLHLDRDGSAVTVDASISLPRAREEHLLRLDRDCDRANRVGSETHKHESLSRSSICALHELASPARVLKVFQQLGGAGGSHALT
jgi:hypothetical protein